MAFEGMSDENLMDEARRLHRLVYLESHGISERYRDFMEAVNELRARGYVVDCGKKLYIGRKTCQKKLL